LADWRRDHLWQSHFGEFAAIALVTITIAPNLAGIIGCNFGLYRPMFTALYQCNGADPVVIPIGHSICLYFTNHSKET
jgi:hypothetical protein